ALPRLREGVEPRARVAHAEQVNAQAHLAGGGDDPERELERVPVRAAVGRVVKVVELAHRGDAGSGHLPEALGRGNGEAVGVGLRGGAVHRRAPGPEVVLPTGCRSLGAAAEEPLESVAVGVDQAREEELAGKALDRGIRRWEAGALAGAVRSDGE